MQHIPVLLEACISLLAPSRGDRMLDVTVGLGGHAKALLTAAEGTLLVAMDADGENLSAAHRELQSFGERVILLHGNFRSLPHCLPADNRSFDIILADLGLSSPHIDDPSRGFTFREDAPLDMRYDRSEGMTAAMLLASVDRKRLATLFREHAELERAPKLADEIIARRRDRPVRTSRDLREVIAAVYGYRAESVFSQVFQALRIEVNDERRALDHLLAAVPALLEPGGRCAIISYHSLEDRSVKQAFRTLTEERRDPVTGVATGGTLFELLTKRPVRPGVAEVASNPRSRSARLRAIRKKELYTDLRSLV